MNWQVFEYAPVFGASGIPVAVSTIDYNLLFRWFVGFSMDDGVGDHATFTKNRDRLLGGDVARQFFAQVLGPAERADLLSKEH